MPLKYPKVFEIARDIANRELRLSGVPHYHADTGTSLYRSTSNRYSATEARRVVNQASDHRWTGKLPVGHGNWRKGQGGLYVSIAPNALFNEGIYYANRNAHVGLLEGRKPNLFHEDTAKRFLERHNRPGNERLREVSPANILSRSFDCAETVIYEYQLGKGKWLADLTPGDNLFLSRFNEKMEAYTEVQNMLQREGFRDLHSYNVHSDDYSVTRALGELILAESGLEGLLVRGARNYLKPGNNMVLAAETAEGVVASLEPERKITVEPGPSGYDTFVVEELGRYSRSRDTGADTGQRTPEPEEA